MAEATSGRKQMADFQIGQRWLSEAEPELGLGTVTAFDRRRVTLVFTACDCTRQYSAAAAPLRRLSIRKGDTVHLCDGRSFSVTAMEQEKGLFVFHGAAISISETELAPTLVLATPFDRLCNGFTDTNDLFELRKTGILQKLRLSRSPVRGLSGGRVALVPHQFAIADAVSRRHVPRVLLADEVGLGKTIEAGLILHRLLLTEQIGRVLILVPDTLLHQWFVELLRRFHLFFRIMDETSCQGICQGQPEANPFLDEERILSPMSMLETPKRVEEILAAGWDMVVMDEAHHVAENTTAFPTLFSIARNTPGLLLLTATPEQMGERNHFAQLKLLDPARYTDMERFRSEATRHAMVAALAGKIMDNAPLSAADLATLSAITGEKSGYRPDQPVARNKKEALLEALLDRHGPGRSIFRNTRAVIKGFPERIPHPAPISPRHSDFAEDRLDWLSALLTQHADEKFLLICKSPDEAKKIEAGLNQRLQVPKALFHEGMNLLQRDRNAAWFASPDGARILISSEIGSEGRNFQFARHLVLLDLPLHPERVEQRIGRLDRIGQKGDIHIHVPFCKDSAGEWLFRWYDEGVGIFRGSVRALPLLHPAFGEKLHTLYHAMEKGQGEPAAFSSFIDQTREFVAKKGEILARGRDRLLEMRAFRPEKIQPLLSAISREDADPALCRFLIPVLSRHGFAVEAMPDGIWRLTWNENDPPALPLPPLRRNPLSATFSREVALAREEIEFFTWDHPLVVAALESFIGSPAGNVAITKATCETPGIFVEAIYLAECLAPARLMAERFLPEHPVHLAADHTGNFLAPASLPEALTDLPAAWLSEHPEITRLLSGIKDNLDAQAEEQRAPIVRDAILQMQSAMDREIERLRALQRSNPAIRNEEIAAFVTEKAGLKTALSAIRLRLDALRVVVAMP